METVVLVLTDVQGSTRLWQDEPAAMNEAMTRHHEIVHGAVAQHGGWRPVDQGEGDAVFAAFRSATAALDAVAQVQRELAAEPWPTTVPLTVRVGVHVGEVTERDGNLYGGPVNRCARLRGLGHGGQTLLSAPVYELVRDRLPTGVTVSDLGEHRMKDLTRPEHVWQLDLDGLPGDFPPLASPDQAEPLSDRRLLGREHDLEEVLARLRPGSLVTLVGPGGVGKSRLAHEVVVRAGSRYPHGAVSVDLSVLESPADLLGAIARSTQLAHDEDSALVQALARLDVLLVLDDSDDLVPELARLCDQLLGAGSRLTLLVTCRERLGSRDEQLWPVLPLPADAARELLLTRARDLAPLAGLADLEVEQLDALTGSVDRLPLAVEMLAAMASLLGVAELQEVVGHRPDLVTSVHRDAPQRHRSLDKLVSASLNRLGADGARALLSLTAFAGAFTAADAVAVLDDSDGLALVRDLVDRSLLSPTGAPGPPRYQVLRTVRVAVTAQAAPAALAAAARRHAEYLVGALAVADRALRGEAEASAAATFDRLGDEARAAHAWARRNESDLAVRLTAALHVYAYSRLWAEPGAWARALVVPGAATAPAVLASLAAQAVQEGRLDDGRSLADEALRSGDEQAMTSALEVLSDLEIYAGRLDDAQARARELVEVGVRTDNPRPVAIGRVDEAFATLNSGRPAQALALLDRDLPPTLSSPAPSERAWLACARGEVLAELGDPGAAPALAEAIRLGDEVGNPFVSGVARTGLASLQAARGASSAAAATLVPAIESFLRHDNVTHLTGPVRNAVPLLAALGETAAAATVAGWVLGPRTHARQGPDVKAVQHTLAALEQKFGSEIVTLQAAGGREFSPAEAAEHTLEALRRHVAEPA